MRPGYHPVAYAIKGARIVVSPERTIEAGIGRDPANRLRMAVVDLTRLPGPAEVFQVRHPGGLLWTFERPASWTDGERIPLVRIADRHGNTLALTYGPLNRVISVLDEVQPEGKRRMAYDEFLRGIRA